MKLHKRMLSLASILAFTACAQQQPAPDTTDTDASEANSEAVRAHVDQFVSAWNSADNATVSSMIAEGAVLLPPDGPVLKGRDAILPVLAQTYDVALSQQSAAVDEVIMIGDYAYARGTWSIEPTPEASADVEATAGRWSVIYERGADEGWQVWRWMWNQPSAAIPSAE